MLPGGSFPLTSLRGAAATADAAVVLASGAAILYGAFATATYAATGTRRVSAGPAAEEGGVWEGPVEISPLVEDLGAGPWERREQLAHARCLRPAPVCTVWSLAS
eukprot:210594-Chlamydomonas_euryale.AAC.6